MPRNVRNFFIEADFDGQETTVRRGPVSKDGGFSMRIHMRDKGDVTTPVLIEGWEGCGGIEGKLALRIRINDKLHLIETVR